MQNNFVVVYTANGHLEGEMVRIYLESGGLHPIINQESAGLTFGLIMGPLSEAKIFVPKQEEENAKEMLIEMGKENILDFENIEFDPNDVSDFEEN